MWNKISYKPPKHTSYRKKAFVIYEFGLTKSNNKNYENTLLKQTENCREVLSILNIEIGRR